MTVLCFLHSMAYVISHHVQFLQMLTGNRRELFARKLKELRHSNPGVYISEAFFSPVRFSYSNVDIDLNYINYYVFKNVHK